VRGKEGEGEDRRIKEKKARERRGTRGKRGTH
jgi:hypothetical protein